MACLGKKMTDSYFYFSNFHTFTHNCFYWWFFKLTKKLILKRMSDDNWKECYLTFFSSPDRLSPQWPAPPAASYLVAVYASIKAYMNFFFFCCSFEIERNEKYSSLRCICLIQQAVKKYKSLLLCWEMRREGPNKS